MRRDVACGTGHAHQGNDALIQVSCFKAATHKGTVFVIECIAAFGTSQTNIVKTCLEKMWIMTWGPCVVIHRVCGQQLTEITRQPPRLVGENPRKGLEPFSKRRERMQSVGRETESEPSLHHCMHHLVLHGPRSGNHILRNIFNEIPPWLGYSSVAVLCVLRNSHETGSTRYRDWWDGRWWKALEELMQQRGVVKLTLSMRHRRALWPTLLYLVWKPELPRDSSQYKNNIAACWLRNPSPS